MRSNIVTEAGLPTRVGQWWEGIPFFTSAIMIICGTIYLVCLLVGYDSFVEICFLPVAILSQFQVYRIFTSVLFHGSLLHVLFNMLALVPLGSELERIMGSIRMLYLTILLAISNAIIHLFIAVVMAHNPLHHYDNPMNECAIGFSGILFSLIVIETSLSGIQSRSVFGLFNVPAQWYVWILLVVFQLLMTNVSFLGHLCGIVSGFAYTYGLLNFLLPGTSFYSAMESSSLLSSCVRRPKFILCTGGNPSAQLPTYSGQNTVTNGLAFPNVWRNLSSWMPRRDVVTEPQQDSRFPGRGRTLGSVQNQTVPVDDSEFNLQTRLLDMSAADHQSSDGRQNNTAVVDRATPIQNQRPVAFDAAIQKLVSMGFEKTQVEVALAAADGDVNIAVEILMSQKE
ncbi:Rhomboid-like protein 15 [Cucurbita argyrosperma subsp. argyrosperma]|nr:Rhomboid-like protein 15 [Cucurbita argyrosperma subsp. argyrosperma]